MTDVVEMKLLAVPAVDTGPQWTPIQQYTTSADATGAVDITAAPVSGEQVVIDDIFITAEADMYVTLQTKTTATAFAVVGVIANTSIQITFRNGLRAPEVDKIVQIDTSAAGNVYVTVSYHSE